MTQPPSPIGPQQPNQKPFTPPDSSTPSAFPGSGGTDSPEYSNMDPLGIWQRFLSTAGNPAKPEDVKRFLETLMKYFNTLIAQQEKKALEAIKKLKTN